MSNLTPTLRTCSVQGCTKSLTAANKSGRCTKHWYVPKSALPSRPRTAARKATHAETMRNAVPTKHASVKSNGGEIGNSRVEVKLRVTPEWLDLAWARLDVEQKAAAIAVVLEA